MTEPNAQAPQAMPPPPPAWAAPEPAGGPAPGVEWAGYGARLVAWILDGLILSVVTTLLVLVAIVLVVGAFATDRSPGLAVLGFVGLLLGVLVVSIAYFPFFWARGGQTPGMRPFGIRVVRDHDGGPVGAGQAILRLLGLWVSGVVFYLGYIWVFIDKRRRGWHDLIGGTVVIKDPARR